MSPPPAAFRGTADKASDRGGGLGRRATASANHRSGPIERLFLLGPTGRCRPIPAHRRAPKLPDDRPRSFTVRIYEAAARGLRRSAVVHGRWLQGELKVIAASLDRSVIEQILNHLELGTQPPHQARRTSRARMARAAPLPPSVHAASVRQGELWPRAWTAPVLRVGRTLSELD